MNKIAVSLIIFIIFFICFISYFIYLKYFKKDTDIEYTLENFLIVYYSDDIVRINSLDYSQSSEYFNNKFEKQIEFIINMNDRTKRLKNSDYKDLNFLYCLYKENLTDEQKCALYISLSSMYKFRFYLLQYNKENKILTIDKSYITLLFDMECNYNNLNDICKKDEICLYGYTIFKTNDSYSNSKYLQIKTVKNSCGKDQYYKDCKDKSECSNSQICLNSKCRNTCDNTKSNYITNNIKFNCVNGIESDTDIKSTSNSEYIKMTLEEFKNICIKLFYNKLDFVGNFNCN